MTDDVEVGDGGVDPQVERTAREMGWTPKDKFKGDPEKWVDAATYVDRGEHVLPILRADRNRLRGELLTRDNEIGTLREQLKTTKGIIADLQDNFTSLVEQRVKERRADLQDRLDEATEDRDIKEVLKLRDELQELNTAEAEAKKKKEENRKKLEAGDKPPANDSTDPQISPEFTAWKKDNEWYGGTSPEDRKRTKAIIRIAEDLREDGDMTEGREFMDKCLELLEEQEGNTRKPHSKVDGGNGRGGTPISGKGYASLPADAKRACDEDAESFVGEGKLFKDVAAWRANYAKIYFGE